MEELEDVVYTNHCFNVWFLALHDKGVILIYTFAVEVTREVPDVVVG